MGESLPSSGSQGSRADMSASRVTLLGFWASVKNSRAWEVADEPWSVPFMRDSELNWQSGAIPLDERVLGNGYG